MGRFLGVVSTRTCIVGLRRASFDYAAGRPMKWCPRCHRGFSPPTEVCDQHGLPLVERLVPFISIKPTERQGLVVADRFRIVGFLDEGGTGRIYVAEDVKTGRLVAVKIPDLPKAQRAAAAARFAREAEMAKVIDHPNVVDAFFTGSLPDGTPVMVMEHLFGETLGERSRRDGPLAVPFVLSVAREVAAALGAAHREGVFHRDVKPDNVFLVGEPGSHHAVKVVDFGHAKVGGERRTSTGTTLGTVEFMAPEQCVADPSDGRTDIYGLGAVMYRTLTGALPFDHREVETLLAKQLVETPIPVRHLAPAVPAQVEAFVHACLRKDPASRPANMEAVEQAIAALQKGQVIDVPERKTEAYVPQGYASRLVASALYRKLGKRPPSFLRVDPIPR